MKKKISGRSEESLEKICWIQKCRDEEEDWSKGLRTGGSDGKRKSRMFNKTLERRNESKGTPMREEQ